MKTYSKEEIKEILETHRLWLQNDKDGKQAYLQGADLQGAYLQGAYLQGADLQGADLQGAYLQGADLRRADLQGADLQGADLRRADLQGADLQGADLRRAYLQGADLRRADLDEKQISLIISFTQIVPSEGDFLAYKWAKRMDSGEKVILIIRVPADAERLSHIASRKCRASQIEILRAETFDEKIVEDCQEFKNWNDEYPTRYKIGEKHKVDDFNSDVRIDCAAGFHFFVTKEEIRRWG